MADLEKTVSILFKGVDDISSTMTTIESGFTSLGGAIGSATAPLAGIATSIEKMDIMLAALAAGGMVAAVSAAGKFESGMSLISTLLSGTPTEIASFEKSISDYASNSTQSIADIQAAIYQALQANIDYKDSIEMLTYAEQLAVAGKSTMTESMTLLTTTMSAYGVGIESAQQFSDIFFKTVEVGNVTIPELSTSLSMVAPLAATMGISLSEVAAAMAALTASGMSSSQSAEYLRQAISNLVDPSAEGKKAMDALGISYGSSALTASGFSGKMDEIYDKTGGSSDKIAELFGNVSSLQVAMVLGADKSGLYAKALEEIKTSAGSTAAAYDKMVGDFENVNTRLTNTMTLALVEAGKPLLDEWAKVAAGVGDVFKGIKVGLDAGAFDEIYAAIEIFSTDVSKYLSDVAKAIPEAMKDVDFSEFLASIQDLGGSVGDLFKKLFGDLDLTKPDDLAKAMQTVVDGVTALSQVSKGILEGLSPFIEKLGELANGALEADGKTNELRGNILGLGQGVNTLTIALEAMAPAVAILSGSLFIKAISSVAEFVSAIGGPAIAVPLAAGVTAIGSMKLAADELGIEFVSLEQFLGGQWIDTIRETIADIEKLAEWLTTPGPNPAFSNDLKTVGETAGEVSRKMNDLAGIPEVLTFTINAETGETKQKLNELDTAILSFPSDFKLTTSIEDNASRNIDALLNKIEAFPATNAVEFIANSKQFDDKLENLIGKSSVIYDLTIESKIKNEDYINNFMSGLENLGPATIYANLDENSVVDVKNSLEKIVNPDGTTTWVDVSVTKGAVEKVNNALKEIPTEKMLEIKLQGEIDTEIERIKANAGNVQAAMEWKAKLDIATAEADAERVKAAFESVGDSISSVTKGLTDILGQDWGKMDLLQYSEALESARQQRILQKELITGQMELLKSQTEYMRAKTDKLKWSDMKIKIDSTGLEPALEEVMWQIIQKVQIKANEESASFLLGMPG